MSTAIPNLNSASAKDAPATLCTHRKAVYSRIQHRPQLESHPTSYFVNVKSYWRILALRSTVLAQPLSRSLWVENISWDPRRTTKSSVACIYHFHMWKFAFERCLWRLSTVPDVKKLHAGELNPPRRCISKLKLFFTKIRLRDSNHQKTAIEILNRDYSVHFRSLYRRSSLIYPS